LSEQAFVIDAGQFTHFGGCIAIGSEAFFSVAQSSSLIGQADSLPVCLANILKAC